MRSSFDKLISAMGLLLAVVLIGVGGLLTWASGFVADQVDGQLSQQDIIMPEGPALEGLPPESAKIMEQYAGSELDSGPEAKAYADHYILAHMNSSGEELAGEPVSYSEASGKARELAAAVAENPNATEEEKAEAQAWMDLRESLFMGNTLRGLLLYGYAFATMGTIAGFAAAASYVAALILLVLAILGFRHAGRAGDKVVTTA